MSGYRWDPVFRVVPTNGIESFYWLSDRLTDFGQHTRIGLKYVESKAMREDINRSIRPVIYGFRPEVTIECLIVSMEDQQFLSEIESALLQPEDYSVFLSLDGGCVEREVVLLTLAEPEPIEGKVVVGAKFRLDVRCVDLVTTRPAMMTDPGVGVEKLQNGGFEEWTSSSDPLGWLAFGDCTIQQAVTAGKIGTWAGHFTPTNVANPYVALVNRAAITLNPGAWHRLTARAKGTALSWPQGLVPQIWNTSYPGSTGALPMALNVSNPTTGQPCKDWYEWGIVQKDTPPTGWADVDIYFRGPVTPFKSTDIFSFRLHGVQNASAGDDLYYDGMSVFGPVLRPGYSTW